MIARRGEELEEDPEGDEGDELDPEGDEVGGDNRQGDHQAGKVDLAEEVGIGDENGGGSGYTGGEIAPGQHAAEVEKHAGQAIGRDLGDLAEDDGEHEGHHERLDDEPSRAEDGLLVFGDEVPSYQQEPQVAVMKQIPPRQPEPGTVRLDHHTIIGFYFHISTTENGTQGLTTLDFFNHRRRRIHRSLCSDF